MELVQKTTAAAPPANDPFEFVMSDNTVDRYGDVIEADGWQLGNFRKNPIALFGHDGGFPIGTWRNVRVEGDRLLGRLELMAPVSERLRELHTAIDAGVLRAVSVGFRAVPDQVEPIESGGLRFLKAELVECSLVAVPANPNALQLAKSLNLSRDILDLIFGKTARDDQTPGRRRSGEPAATPRRKPQAMEINTERFATLIEKTQDRILSLQAEITAQVENMPEDDEEAIAQATTLINELTNRCNQARATLTTLTAAEQGLGSTSEPVSGTRSPAVPGTGNGRAVSFPRKAVSREAEKSSDYWFRVGAAMFVAHKIHRPLYDVIREAYPHDYERTQAVAGILTRAAVPPATTTLAGWAAELVERVNYDLVDLLPVDSIYGPLSMEGPRFGFGRNGIVNIPARTSTPTVAGSFVGEGQPIPVRRAGFSSIQLTPKKMAVITSWTAEIAEHSTPPIEQFLREAIGSDTSAVLDSVLIDNNAATTIRPAGLRNGANSQTPTALGSSAFNAIVGDLKTSVKFLAAANSLRNPVWIFNPGDAAAAALITTPNGDFAFQSQIQQNMLLGYKLITSSTQPAGTYIFLDAADFLSATGDAPEFAVSDQATLHMEDTNPQNIGVAGSATAPAQSMFQTDSVALRMKLPVNWAMRRSGVVTYCTGLTWT